jgi:MFS family permease
LQFVAKLREEFAFIKGNYFILALSWIIMDFAMELPGTYYSKYVLELYATEFILGVIMFVSFLTLALVQFPGGYLADKYGRRWLISTMTFGVALSYILYAIAPSWHLILVGAVVGNLCLIYQPALMSMVADSLPPERRGMGYSIVMLIATVSTTPAPLAARALVIQYGLVNGMRIGYFIVVVMFLAAAAIRVKLKETIRDPEKISFRDVFSSYRTALKESVRVWKVVPRSMLYLFVAMTFGTFSIAMIQPFFVVYALDELHISEADWPLALTLLFAMMIIASMPVGKLIDRVGRKIPLLLAYVLFIPPLLLFVYGDLPRLFIALPLFGLAQILFMTSFSSLQADLVPKEQRGKVTGFSNFFNYIFMALGSLVGGALYYFVAPQLPFLFMIPLLVPPFILTLLLVHEPEKRQE